MKKFLLTFLLLLAISSFGQPLDGRLYVGGFRPIQVSAIKYWLDAGTITGISNGSNITAASWSDQSVNARGNLVSSTNVVYRSDAGNGLPAVEFTGGTSYCVTPSFSVSQPLTIFMVLKQITWGVGRRFIDGASVNRVVVNQMAVVAPKIGMFSVSSVQPTDDTTDTNYISLIEANFNGAASAIYSNKNGPVTGNPGSNGVTDGFTLGGAGGGTAGFYANYQLLEFIVCDSTLGGQQRALLRQYLAQKHRLITRSVLVCNGNSLTAGSGAPAGSSYPDQLLPLIGGTNYWRAFKLEMSADAASQVDPLMSNFSRKLLLAWEITDDITISNATATVAEDNWLGYCTNRLNAGWSLLTFTVIPRKNFTPTMQGYANTVNAWMRTNWQTFASGIVDVAADSRLSNFANTNYFNADGIHLNANGYAVVAELAAQAMAVFHYP